ncbi:MAG TPA: hypothetical protein VF048_09130, partial [Gemmatimonadaceae bacterium]
MGSTPGSLGAASVGSGASCSTGVAQAISLVGSGATVDSAADAEVIVPLDVELAGPGRTCEAARPEPLLAPDVAAGREPPLVPCTMLLTSRC